MLRTSSLEVLSLEFLFSHLERPLVELVTDGMLPGPDHIPSRDGLCEESLLLEDVLELEYVLVLHERVAD